MLLCLMAGYAWSQNATLKVTGNIVAKSDGFPIIGASVVETGKQPTNGTITDLDGNFTLTVDKNATLTVTYVGYKTVTLKAESNMQITLEEANELLDEVVVTGYATQRKADLTGSVSVISVKDLKANFNTDPMRALQGHIPGVTITSDGSPSGTGTVRIRGIGSMNASQDPLYIIDGVPSNQTLNSLNTNDIETMQVLKDAASASIYGSRAANGVIIITTKQGKKSDKVNVDFSANLTASFYTQQSLMDLCNSGQYATAMAQAALNDGLDPVAYARNYGMNLNASTGIPITVWNPAISQYVNYTVNGAYDGYINSDKTMRFSDTDWLDAISRTGFAQNYDLSVSHATDKHSAMFSLGYKKSNGILKYTDFENISARMNASYNLGKYVTVGENFTLTYTNQVNASPMENALKMPSIVPVYEEDGTTFAGPVGSMNDRQNPLRELYHNKDNRMTVWRLFGNAYVDVKPVEGLVLHTSFGIDYDTAFTRSLTHTFHSDIVNNDTNATTLSQANDMKWTWTNTGQYSFTIADKNRFSILLGTEMFRQTRVDFNQYSEGYAIETPEYMWPNAATGTTRNAGAEVGYTLASFFGKADYNYDDLILASFTIRRDGSSRFGRNNRWGVFPAASLGFRVSQLLDADWLNDLKIRLSWGQTGNQAIDNNAQFGLYVADYGLDRVTATAYDLYLQGSGIFPSGYRNSKFASPNIKWETATQYNVGIDFAFFNSTLYGSIDGYVKQIDDMLVQPAYLGAMGEGGSTWYNGPSMRNWGMEFQIGYRKTLSCGLGIDASTNFDFYRNRVTYIPEYIIGTFTHTTTENLVESKQPYGAGIGYVVEGIFQSQAEIDAAPTQTGARVGGLRYADLTGNGVVDADDQTWIFNPIPKLSMGVNLAFSYKDFDLSMFWQGVFGHDIYNAQKAQTDFWSLADPGSNKGSRLLNAWTTDNTDSTIPALTTTSTSDEGRSSTYWVEKGTYFKLRDLQVGYTFPAKLLSKFKMRSARIYVAGQNLLTIKSKSATCPDPEHPDWAYPLSTSVSFGLQFGF